MKRFISFLLVFILVLLIVPVLQISAVTGNEIVNYAEQFKGYPYVYSAAGPNAFDCSGFVKYVFGHFEISLPHGTSYFWNNPTAYGTIIGENSTANALPGDLICWAGHIAIYIGDGYDIEALNPTDGVCIRKVNSHNDAYDEYNNLLYYGWNYKVLRVYGVTWNDTDVSVPTISFNKTSFIVGEKVNITWQASPNDSDFEHYWLVIRNTTTGNQFYGGATGGDGDVSKNYYDLSLTEAGTYKVDVYATNHSGGGKSDSKTFTVGEVEVSKPTISFNKNSYTVGETAHISWVASSNKSDFKHYWLVIRNTTTGNQFYGGATGGDGDVSKNYYDLSLTEAGTYKVDVYAVNHGNDGKSDSKTFVVSNLEVSKPTISFNKNSYTVGEIAHISWVASSNKSDFKHYWLVIRNTTTGNQFYGGATGGDGDVSKNYYDLSLTEAGTYKVDVYAVNHGNDGKSDSKTFVVKAICSHDYVYKVTKEATCTQNGEMICICADCGDSYTEPIPATGNHIDEDNNGYCDGCGEMMQGGNHCRYCGQIHGGAFGWLVKIFHNIFALFKR